MNPFGKIAPGLIQLAQEGQVQGRAAAGAPA